jgi:CheY-like chemotaxis protein
MDRKTAPRALEILLVEDDREDAQMTIEALGEGSVPCRVHLVSDGDDALRFLRREGPFAAARRPDVVLLDMQLPRMDGRQVLAEIRADERLRDIPVLVMTSSRVHQALLEAEQLRVDSYVAKPVTFREFAAAMKSLPGD